MTEPDDAFERLGMLVVIVLVIALVSCTSVYVSGDLNKINVDKELEIESDIEDTEIDDDDSKSKD